MRGDMSHHFWMTRGVARSMGLNLTESMKTGGLSAEGYEAMVNRCRCCALVEQCVQWLASQQHQASSPPPGCAISEPLLNLAGRRPGRGIAR